VVLSMSMMPALAFSLKVSRSDLFQRAEVSFERCGDDIVRYERSERLVGVGCVVGRAVFFRTITTLTRNDRGNR
jgi:hypothetical protein